MSAEINFILTIAFLAVVTFICLKAATLKESRYLLGSTKMVTYLGMGFLIIGAALFSTYGLYGIALSAPFIIVGLIINFVTAYKTRSGRDTILLGTPQESRTISTGNYDHETLNQITESARARGMLVEQPNPSNPGDTVLQIRCPSCDYLFELGTSKIVELTVYCPSCYKGTDLS